MKTNCEKDPEIPEVKQKDITAKKDGNIFKDFSRQSLSLILTLFILFNVFILVVGIVIGYNLNSSIDMKKDYEPIYDENSELLTNFGNETKQGKKNKRINNLKWVGK